MKDETRQAPGPAALQQLLVPGHHQQLALLILHLVQLVQQLELELVFHLQLLQLPFGSTLEVQQLLLVQRLLLQLLLHSPLYGVLLVLLLPELHELPT
jgi:hypothetical protein